MSVFGGVAVFAVLGFMAKQYNIPVGDVVQSGERHIEYYARITFPLRLQKVFRDFQAQACPLLPTRRQ